MTDVFRLAHLRVFQNYLVKKKSLLTGETLTLNGECHILSPFSRLALCSVIGHMPRPCMFENIRYDVESSVFLEDSPPTNESCVVMIESKSKKLERERGV